MENNSRSLKTDAVGFCLLPSELIQAILLNLPLPEILRLKLLSKSIATVISDPVFVRQCNIRSRSAPWLFVYWKQWRQDSTLLGFTDRSNSWYEIPVNSILKPITHPGEDLFFLTASGNVFLFASNTNQEVLAVNLVSRTVKKIPPSPLGPRGTSSWRRSGMKLVSGSNGTGHFRFMFAEMVGNHPILFQYDSQMDEWQSIEANDHAGPLPRAEGGEDDHIYLSVINRPTLSIVIAIKPSGNGPMVLRPRLDWRGNEGQQLAIGLGWGNQIDMLQVYGDGYMIIARSNAVDGVRTRVRMLASVEMWRISSDGRHWECISTAPNGIVDNVKKPYEVTIGCLEERSGILRTTLITHFEGLWNVIWLSYDVGKDQWTRVQVPDCRMKAANLAGITFSSGLTMS